MKVVFKLHGSCMQLKESSRWNFRVWN